jgi:hypothetical protein
LATQREVTRSPEASEKRQGCRAPKERALSKQDQWIPTFAEMLIGEKRAKFLQRCATKERKEIQKNPACANKLIVASRRKRRNKNQDARRAGQSK